MKLSKLFAIAAIATLTFTGACTKIDPGEVGVKVNTLGSGGVQEAELGAGWHVCAVGCQIYTYPIIQDTVTWSSSEGADGPRISFTNKDGVQTTVGVSIQVRIDSEKASNLVSTYRRDMEQLKMSLVRRTFQNAFNNVGKMYSSEDLARGSVSKLYSEVYTQAASILSKSGIIIEAVDQTGPIGLPENIQDQINDKVASEQEAQKQQAQVAVVEAQAQQVIAEARGRAESIELEGQAIRANPEILRLREIQNNKGICPSGVHTCIVGSEASSLVAN